MMYLPRRHFRRLLLPPGWVALGFLLLLGCQALLTHRRQMLASQEGHIHLVVPALKLATAIIQLTSTPAYKQLADLETLSNWQTIEFTGAPLHNFLNTAVAEAAFRKSEDIDSQTGGPRLRFYPSASYATLIAILNTTCQVDQSIYLGGRQYNKRMALVHRDWNWLDVRHQPVTFYAVTEKVSSKTRRH